MSTGKKLDGGEKHFMRLIAKGADADGWARVSKPLYPLVDKMPKALVELEPTQDGWGRARLTDEGESVLRAMEVWL